MRPRDIAQTFGSRDPNGKQDMRPSDIAAEAIGMGCGGPPRGGVWVPQAFCISQRAQVWGVKWD